MSAFRYRWLDAVWASELSPLSKLVAVAFGSYMDPDGTCWPSQPTLAGRTGLSERGLRQIIKRDLEGVWLELKRTPGRATRYRAVVPDPGTVRSGVDPGTARAAHPGTGPHEPRHSLFRRTPKNPVREPDEERIPKGSQSRPADFNGNELPERSKPAEAVELQRLLGILKGESDVVDAEAVELLELPEWQHRAHALNPGYEATYRANGSKPSPCPYCDFIAGNQGGLGNHLRACPGRVEAVS